MHAIESAIERHRLARMSRLPPVIARCADGYPLDFVDHAAKRRLSAQTAAVVVILSGLAGVGLYALGRALS